MKSQTILEKDIEQYLFDNPEEVVYSELKEMGFSYIEKWLHRQFNVPSGIIDLLGVTNDGHLAVVELKRGDIDSKAISQVCRYTNDIRDAVNAITGNNSLIEIKKIVIGKSIDKKTMFEARAMGVMCSSYECDHSGQITVTPAPFSCHDIAEIYRLIEPISLDKLFVSTVNELQSNLENEQIEIMEWVNNNIINIPEDERFSRDIRFSEWFLGETPNMKNVDHQVENLLDEITF